MNATDGKLEPKTAIAYRRLSVAGTFQFSMIFGAWHQMLWRYQWGGRRTQLGSYLFCKR